MHDKVGAEQLQQVHHCTTQTGGSDCGPEGQRSAPSGSRRAATGVRNNRRVCSETMEDHDRRFGHRRPLTWRSSHALTVLNTTKFHAGRPGADLARRKPGVQIPSPPPHNPAAQSVVGASSAALLSFLGPPGATLGPRPARRGSRTTVAVRCRLGGAVQRVQAVAERGVGLRVQVAVTVEGEAHRGMAGPGGDLLGVGPGRDPWILEQTQQPA